jgi:hypothetical protein
MLSNTFYTQVYNSTNLNKKKKINKKPQNLFSNVVAVITFHVEIHQNNIFFIF